MKLPSRLARSRHGVFYYRLQFQIETKRKELRISLQTKSPHIAKIKAFRISAMMLGYNSLDADMPPFDPNDPNALAKLLKGNHQKFDIELPGGVKLTNINTPSDVEGALTVIKSLNVAAPKVVQNTQTSTPPQPQTLVDQDGGTTVDEMIPRFQTRKKNALSEKTLYEYGNYHRNFSAWITKRKGKKNLPIRLVNREDIAAYIDDLKAEGLSDKTIQQKYLAALSGLFELAQSSGVYPKEDMPTRGHKVFTKRIQKKQEPKTGYKPFTDEELTNIFSPDNLLTRPKPDDFWLPLLGLFTGGRIAELCQLSISDIYKSKDIWALSINDEEYKKLKTDAARRVIPIHPQLIALGFLDYVEDANQHGTMLFPYLTADRFGNFSHTPSERFGDYLDTVGITHPQKVFHSFRKTSNNKLKQSKVAEETRCQFIGHEHETTNSFDYGEEHDLAYLLEHAASKLIFEGIEFDKLTYTKGRFSKKLEKLCAAHIRMKNHREAKAKREEALKNKAT